MRKTIVLTMILCLFFSLSIAQDADKNETNRDMGNASKDSYVNTTYKVELKLPQGNWMLLKGQSGLIRMNGKVAEYWNVEKDIRVVLTIEESKTAIPELVRSGADVIANQTAGRTIEDLRYSYQRVTLIKAMKHIKSKQNITLKIEEPPFMYYQSMEATSKEGQKLTIENYLVIKKEQGAVRINLLIISPVITYFENRLLHMQIFKEFKVDNL